MSRIVEQVGEDLKAAMKAKDSARVAALRMVRAAIIEAQKSGRGEVDEAEAEAILRRLRKQREEAADSYAKGGRDDLAANERAEMAIIDAYLPSLADEDTTRAWVREVIAQTGASDPKQAGRVMGALMKAHKGEVDGALARAIIDAELGA